MGASCARLTVQQQQQQQQQPNMARPKRKERSIDNPSISAGSPAVEQFPPSRAVSASPTSSGSGCDVRLPQVRVALRLTPSDGANDDDGVRVINHAHDGEQKLAAATSSISIVAFEPVQQTQTNGQVHAWGSTGALPLPAQVCSPTRPLRMLGCSSGGGEGSDSVPRSRAASSSASPRSGLTLLSLPVHHHHPHHVGATDETMILPPLVAASSFAASACSSARPSPKSLSATRSIAATPPAAASEDTSMAIVQQQLEKRALRGPSSRNYFKSSSSPAPSVPVAAAHVPIKINRNAGATPTSAGTGDKLTLLQVAATEPVRMRRLNPVLPQGYATKEEQEEVVERLHSKAAVVVAPSTTSASTSILPPETAAVVPVPKVQSLRTSSSSSSSPIPLHAGAPPAEVAAPTLGAGTVSAEQVRSLHAHLCAPSLMGAEAYRAQYPSYDSHNADYMAYRARWERAEKEAAASAANLPGSRPRASSRSILCTPKSQDRTLASTLTLAASSAESGSTPSLSPEASPFLNIRTLTPRAEGSFGFGSCTTPPLLITPSASAGGSCPSSVGSSSSDVSLFASPLYLPPPTFLEDLPADFIHRNSVLAFMVQARSASSPSSSPASLSLTTTPLANFVRLEAKNLANANANAVSNIGGNISALPSPLSCIQTTRLARAAQASPRSSDSPRGGETVLSSFQPRHFSSREASSTTTTAFVPVLPSSHAEDSSSSSSSAGMFKPPTPRQALPPLLPASSPNLALMRRLCGPTPSGSGSGSGASSSDSRGQRVKTTSAAGAAVPMFPEISPSQPQSLLVPQSQSPSARQCFSEGLLGPPRRLSVSSSATCTTSQNLQLQQQQLHRRCVAYQELMKSAPASSSARTAAAPATDLPGSCEEVAAAAAAPDNQPPSEAVLRAQAHIASVTRGWQERVTATSDSPTAAATSGATGRGAGLQLPPAAQSFRHRAHARHESFSPSNSASSALGVRPSHPARSDPRSASCTSVTRKLRSMSPGPSSHQLASSSSQLQVQQPPLPRQTVRRTSKCMLLTLPDSAMSASTDPSSCVLTPASLPPVHHPLQHASSPPAIKRILAINSATTSTPATALMTTATATAAASAVDGSYSPSPSAAAVAAALVNRSASSSPQQIARRRLQLNNNSSGSGSSSNAVAPGSSPSPRNAAVPVAATIASPSSAKSSSPSESASLSSPTVVAASTSSPFVLRTSSSSPSLANGGSFFQLPAAALG